MSPDDLLSDDNGLSPVRLCDRPVFARHLNTIADPLSDYTFSQIFTWRNSLRLAWKIIRGHLCVFANGSGDLTLLLPPLGDTGTGAALAEAHELMDTYNAAHGVPERSRVEYVSESMLARFDQTQFDAFPMGGDYVYDVARMIDLAGGDLKSKRQEKNRFARNYSHRTETYDATRHLNACLRLLQTWRDHQDAHHATEINAGTVATKRHKESLATELALCHAKELGLGGMVVWVADESGNERVAGFTFGELLGDDQSSIVIEKTDLAVKGLPQFIFSEFCRLHWSHRPLVNAGDDWGVESLAWTKKSYRPVKRLQKFALVPRVAASLGIGFEPLREPAEQPTVQASNPPAAPVNVRLAKPTDLPAAAQLESICFDAYNLSRRQLQYLANRASAVMLVADDDGAIVGEAIGLLRRHKRGLTGRVYSLAVAGTHRGRGIGRQLLSDLLNRFVDRGVRRVYLEVEKSNAGAIHLYESLGFRAIGTLADYYGENRPGVHMVCETGVTPKVPRPLAA
jgi:ribosomal protein S18 acetylase RimI-like enzyme